jgi:hypothetical protein
MAVYIKFALEDGGTVLVQVREEEEGVVKTGLAKPGEVVENAKISFERALDGVKPMANLMLSKLRELVNPPDEIEVEFGINLSAEVGAVVATAAAEANYSVTLTWKRSSTSSRTT